jgi:hypothetical protein
MSGKILFMGCGAPPAVVSSAPVIINLAQQFTRDEMVVVGEKPYGTPPFHWGEGWPELLYIQSVWPCTRHGLRWWRTIQLPFALWKCLRVARRHRIRSILVIFPEERFLLMGYLTARLLKCRLFPYFHNTYLENRRGLARVFARWLQPRVFDYAEHVFMMSEGMSELYRERYPHLGQSPLLHSFNEPLPSGDVPPTIDSPMKLAICGTVNESCKDAAIRLGEAVASSPDVRLSIYGPNDPNYLRSIGLLRDGMQCATVSREELLRNLRAADVLLLPHGLTGSYAAEEYRTMFPGKTIDYLMSGRPILAHTLSDCFLTRFLRRHDCALIVDQPDVQALRQALEQLRADYPLRRRLVENALKAARQFQAKDVAAELRKWLAREPSPQRR